MYRLVFEDSERSLTMLLYRNFYTVEQCKTFSYLNGVGNLAEFLRNNKDDELIVFIDLPVGNPSIASYWNSGISKLAKEHKNNVVILPVICSEYCLLSSLDGAFFKRNGFNLLDDYLSQTKISSYEVYCKSVLIDKVHSCVSKNSKVDCGKYFMCYYSKDCPSVPCLQLGNEPLKKKSERIVMSYPVYYNFDTSVDIPKNVLYNAHCGAIRNINMLVDLLRAKGVKQKYLVTLY